MPGGDIAGDLAPGEMPNLDTSAVPQVGEHAAAFGVQSGAV
jgi:hypothetical protein